jgi:hypothetical protein
MPEQTIAEALPYVQMAAARLIHRVASTDYDQDDLRQDLTVILLTRISKFDPARASLARFVWVLADHHVANVRGHRRAQRRDHRRAEPFWENNSLNAREFDGNDLTSLDQYESAFGRYSRTATEVIELRLDVARVVNTLPPELKAVASILQAGSIETTARAVGASRATVYRKSRGVLRAAFMKAGLDRYVSRVTVAPRRKAA